MTDVLYKIDASASDHYTQYQLVDFTSEKNPLLELEFFKFKYHNKLLSSNQIFYINLHIK